MNNFGKIVLVVAIVLLFAVVSLVAMMAADREVLKKQREVIKQQSYVISQMEKFCREKICPSSSGGMLPGTKVVAYDKDGKEVLVRVKSIAE